MEIVSDFSTAKTLMKKYHYSHTCPVGRGFVAYDEDDVIFSIAMGPVRISDFRLCCPMQKLYTSDPLENICIGRC